MEAWMYLVVGVILVLLYILDRISYRTGLPGPKGIPLLGIGPKLALLPRVDMYKWFGQIFQTYGGTVEVNIAGLRAVLIADPADAEVLLSDVKNITKGRFYFTIKPLLANGLLLSSGDTWHQKRKLLTPIFHFKILDDSVNHVTHIVDRFVHTLLETNGQAIRVDDLIKTTSLDVICESGFGISMDSENKTKHDFLCVAKSLTDQATEWFFSFWLHIGLLFRWSSLGRSYYKNISIVHSFIREVVDRQKKSFVKNQVEDRNNTKNQRFAFLDRLLEIDAEYPGKLSFEEESITFTFGGYDTTAAALTFALFLLAKHQDVQEKALNEQYSIFGNEKRQPKKNDLQEMSYLNMIIKETLRLYPSAPAFTRTLSRDITLSGGKVVPAGYDVFILALYVHRNTDYWENPEEFCPERFAPGISHHPFSYIPFSAGPRNCIGQKFAMMEMKLYLSAILRRFRIEPVTTEIKVYFNLILKAETPIELKFIPRK